MATIKGTPPGDNPLPGPRERVVFRSTRWGMVAQKWPRKRGRSTSPFDIWHRGEFGVAARFAASVVGEQLASAIELCKGSENVPRDFLTAAAMGIVAQMEFEDGTKIIPATMVNWNPTFLLDQITDAPGAVLARGPTEWSFVPPGMENQVLTWLGGEPVWADDGGGGGGSAWTILHDASIPNPSANIDVDVTGYHDSIVIVRAVTCSVSGLRTIRFSVDNGATFPAAAGDYWQITAQGAESSSTGIFGHSTGSTGPRSSIYWLPGHGTNGTYKTAFSTALDWKIFTQSQLPVTTIRVSAGTGNMTGGTLQVLAR